MKEKVTDEDDELRPSYDFKSLQVRKLGPGRKRFGIAIPKKRRREIHENAEAGLTEYQQGKHESFSDIDDLMHSLDHD